MKRNHMSLTPWIGVALGLGTFGLLRARNRYSFRGKKVLITGGSRGLGLVLARELGRQGARIALCARDEDELERAQDELASRRIFAQTIVCDLSDSRYVLAMVEEARRKLGGIDVLINNAGIIQVGPESTMTESDYEEALKVHFWAPFHAIQAVLPEFRARKAGRIVNISSIGGKVAAPHLLPYNVSKYALTGFSEGLGAELAREGISVTTVIPGLMRTGSPGNALFKGKHRAEFTWFDISDSLPVVSMGAERAARKIIEACRAGKREIVLTPAAKAAVAFHGLFPSSMVRLLGVVNRALPSAGGIGTKAVPGRESATALAPSVLTTLTNRAADRNNERKAG
jgi:short-subunit dehydrogenase